MQFMLSLALLAATAIASPIAPRATKEFKLKSSCATHAKHNHLYVYTYHTGAGLNDATLAANASAAPSVYLNGTEALFDLGTDYPWGMAVTGDTNYACKYFVSGRRCLPAFSRFRVC